jgi:hypothetical protein
MWFGQILAKSIDSIKINIKMMQVKTLLDCGVPITPIHAAGKRHSPSRCFVTMTHSSSPTNHHYRLGNNVLNKKSSPSKVD